MLYWIHEDNEDRMRKHSVRLTKKAKACGVEISMHPTGEEEFRKNGTRVLRYVQWEVSGDVISRAGWRYVATVEHGDAENVLRRYDTTAPEIPERYRHTRPVCEHCKTERARKDTYLVYNETSGDWKQVGRSCLREFSGGLSPEAVAAWISAWEEAVACEAPGEGGEKYFEVDEVLAHAMECTRIRGFSPTRAPEDWTGAYVSTVCRVTMHMTYDSPARSRMFRSEIRECLEDVRRGYDVKKADVEGLKAWCAGLTGSEYADNLRVLCGRKYCTVRDFGILCSAPHVWRRETERKERLEKEASQRKLSQHVGAVGERIKINVARVICLTSYETQWGRTSIYKIVDTDGNSFVWKTSGNLCDDAKVMTATVKAHGEYKGEKQTEVNRCKVIEK